MTFAKRVLAVTEEQFNKWDSSRQREYLKKHPTSKFGQNKSGKVLKKGTNNKRVPSPNQSKKNTPVVKDPNTFKGQEKKDYQELTEIIQTMGYNAKAIDDASEDEIKQTLADFWYNELDHDKWSPDKRHNAKIRKTYKRMKELLPTLKKYKGGSL